MKTNYLFHQAPGAHWNKPATTRFPGPDDEEDDGSDNSGSGGVFILKTIIDEPLYRMYNGSFTPVRDLSQPR